MVYGKWKDLIANRARYLSTAAQAQPGPTELPWPGSRNYAARCVRREVDPGFFL